MSETERFDGDELEAEANSLIETFNGAAKSYSPDLEWFGMSTGRDSNVQHFVFEATNYIDGDGLLALRELGRPPQYIEAYEFDDEVRVQIQILVEGKVRGSDVIEYGDRLAGAISTMRGEADELEARNDVDPHMTDVIAGLRHHAGELDSFLQDEYYREVSADTSQEGSQ